MKNTIKLIGIIALVAVIGFSMAACGDGGDDGNGGGNGSLGSTLIITNAQVYSIVGYDNEYNEYQISEFTGTVANLNHIYDYEENSLNELIDGNPTVTLVKGKLNVTLGTPKASSLKDMPTLPPGITASTSGVKIFTISGFTDGLPNVTNVFQDKYEFYEGGRLTSTVEYYYSNKDVKISGTYTYTNSGGTRTGTFAMNIKAGWNSVISNTTRTGYTMKTGTPPADYKWKVYPH